MSVKDLGKSFEQVIEDIVLKTAKTIAKELPSVDQLKALEERTKSIEVTLNHILKKAGGNPLRKSNRGRKPGAERVCSVAGCNRPVVARTMCSMHYQRWRADDARQTGKKADKPASGKSAGKRGAGKSGKKSDKAQAE